MFDLLKRVFSGFKKNELVVLPTIELPPRRSTFDIFNNEPVKLMRIDCVPTLQCRLDWQERFYDIELEDVFEHHDECDCERCNVEHHNYL